MNPIIPKTNATPGAGAPGSLLLGEVATNRSAGEVYLGADGGVVLVGERVTSIARGGTGSTSAAAALVALGAAPLVSPAFSGTPTVPTASVGTNTTQAASTAFVQANRGDRYLTTSTTSWLLSNGTQAFTVDAGLSYTPTQDVTVVYDLNNHAHGTVVSYSGTTLTIDFTQHTGAGTYSAWTINVGGLSVQEGALLQANNLSDVADAATALANIGGFSNTATLDILHGGTGATDQQSALNALAGAQTASRVLAGDGTNVTLRQLTTADVPTLSQLGGFATTQILGLTSGGTGATSAQAALNALAGAVASGQVLAGDGSNVMLRALGTADLPVIPIEKGGLGISSRDQIPTQNPLAPHYFIIADGRSSATLTGTVTNNVFTASANGALSAGDGYAWVDGDLMLNIGTIAGSSSLHLGPWIVTSKGSASTPIVLTRPEWFRGVVPVPMFQFLIRNGTTIQGSIQIIRVSTLGGGNSITVGTTPLSNLGSAINASGASFSGTVVFRQNTTSQSAARFNSAAALMTTQVPHSLQWDNQRMYLTNISSQTFAVAYTSDIAPLTSTAPSALATAAVLGISTQAARADHQHPLPLGSTVGAALAAAAAAGTSTEAARADHVHPLPLGSTVGTALAASASAGTATQAARADHVHPLPLPAINSTALTSYTLALADNNATVRTTAATAVAVTIPLNSSIGFPVGSQVLLMQAGAGQITVAGAGGVTLRSNGGKTKTAAQYSLATLLKIATDEWVLGGDISA